MEVTGAPRSQTDVERSCSRLGPKGSESRSFDPHNKCPVRTESFTSNSDPFCLHRALPLTAPVYST